MSYLSTSENVGFSGIPQNISDASCATQYKMAVDGVSGGCSEVNMFIHDNSGDEQNFITHLNDNLYTKFKIDPNELYTFHDSDVIASEITVSHTEDTFIFPDTADIKGKLLDSPSNELDLIGAFTNGEIKHEIKKEVVSNGHYTTNSKPFILETHKDKKSTTSHTKVQKTKSQVKEPSQKKIFIETRRPSVHSPKSQPATALSPSIKNSINSVNTNNSNPTSTSGKQSNNGVETFLDVFKREQGLVENSLVTIKTESPAQPPLKTPTSPPKKVSSGKTPAQSKARRGRGPAVHEALQRIPTQSRAIPLPISSWHAPGDNLFSCGPLEDKRSNTFRFLESSSDEDNMPDFESGCGDVCVEEAAAESRGARLALRRAALRRHVARAHTALRLATDYKDKRTLATVIKKQLNGKGQCRLPTQTVNHLLAMRSMPAVLTAQERRRLRETGWSGGESGSREHTTGGTCVEDRCTQPPLPCARYCLSHVTLAAEQRLYAACAAVFAGGARCKQPLLPLQDQTPLCAEHAWKRDNYDKLSRDFRPKKAVRKRVCPPAPRPPRRPKRRRRVGPKQRPGMPELPPSNQHSLSEINVCSNSSTYDSSEDTGMGALSENEYITVANNSHELEVEVGHVPADDILDPAVLSQIPDEAFTEFFNRAEGSAPFAETSELAAALEAVLEERPLDNIADVFTNSPHHQHKNKVKVPSSVPMEMSPSEPS